jgi:transitional endoplasmic reticulum ATPase
MTDQTGRVLTPRVTEALARDLGKGLVRLDPSDIEKLGLKLGGVVELAGRRKTVGRLVPTYSAHRGRERVQIDGVTRENAGVSIDNPVVVRPVEAHDAELAILIPISAPPTDAELRTMPRMLAGLPVVVGDRVRVNLIGQRVADFKVARTVPSGPVTIAANTRLEFGRVPSPALHATERRSFRAFAFEDVGGLRRVLKRVREIVELPLKYPEVFERLGVEPPKGVLLHGPPGCGKTLIARAVAHETDAAFFQINGPEIIQKYHGESEARLREVFELATRQAPSIVFLDEIDVIAPKRERVAGDVEKRVVAQLLALMDGLSQRPQVVVLAATNMPNLLDPALRRPGRFDREIAIPIPDRDARREILEVHRRGMPLAESVDLDHLAAVTHGFVGADLESLCREAALACLRRWLPRIELDSGAVPLEILQKLEVSSDDFNAARRVVEPSAVGEVFVERSCVTWADVGGLDEAKRRLTEAVAWPLAHASLFARAGVRPPRGVLLSGPPGCGKTLLATAVANELGVNLLAVKGPEVLSRFVGETERAVRDIFRKARQAAPCVVFFDEIDALLPDRGAGSADDKVGERVMGQFFAEMDGSEGLDGVLILGATNRPDRLDPALLRPGRFETHLIIPPPDRPAREAIARIALRKTPVADDVSPADVSAACEGFTGAEIRSVCDRAALAAVRAVVESGKLDGTSEPVVTAAMLAGAVAEMIAERSGLPAAR